MTNPTKQSSTHNENGNANNSNAPAYEDEQYEDLSNRTSQLAISSPPTSNPNPPPDARFQISPVTSPRPTDAELEARMDSAWYYNNDFATYLRVNRLRDLRIHRASALSAQTFNLSNSIPVPPLILMGHDSTPQSYTAEGPLPPPPQTPVIRPVNYGALESIQQGSPSSSSAHAGSSTQQAQGQMEHWVCGNEQCEWKNRMSAARCVGCGWEVLDSMCLVRMGDGTWEWGFRRS